MPRIFLPLFPPLTLSITTPFIFSLLILLTLPSSYFPFTEVKCTQKRQKVIKNWRVNSVGKHRWSKIAAVKIIFPQILNSCFSMLTRDDSFTDISQNHRSTILKADWVLESSPSFYRWEMRSSINISDFLNFKMNPNASEFTSES